MEPQKTSVGWAGWGAVGWGAGCSAHAVVRLVGLGVAAPSADLHAAPRCRGVCNGVRNGVDGHGGGAGCVVQ